MSTSSTTTATQFSFSIWPSEPRPNADANASGTTGGSAVERRERISRWRAKRDTSQQWEAEHVRNVRPLRLRPPTQRHSVSGSGQGQQAATDATEQETRLAPGDFDPYGWAAILWLCGLALDHNAYHLMPYFWAVVALVGIVFKHGPHYLFTSGVVVALGYFLFQIYFPI